MKITLKNLLDTLDSIPLDIAQYKEIANTPVCIEFTELLRYKNLDDIFQQLGNKILVIVLQTQNYGHFGVLFKQSSNRAVYYESLGMTVEELINISPFTKQKLNGINPLKRLENNSGIKVDYNIHKHQKDGTLKNQITTCSFHSANRLRFPLLTNDEYDYFIQSTGMNPDDFVVLTSLNKVMDMKLK